MHGRPLIATRREILHAGSKVFRVVLRQADALVFLGVGQARVHGKQEARVVAPSVEGIGVTRAPSSLQSGKQPGAGRRPKILGEQNARRLEQIGVLLQPVPRYLQGGCRRGRSTDSNRGLRFVRRRRRGLRKLVRRGLRKLVRRGLRLDHPVGVDPGHARIVQRVAYGIHLAPHGVRHHGNAAANPC